MVKIAVRSYRDLLVWQKSVELGPDVERPDRPSQEERRATSRVPDT
jgi:hypothetical protein